MKPTRLVPAVAALALLVGCSPTPGTAAVVHGARISETEVSQALAGCAEALGYDASKMRRTGVMQTMVIGKIFDRLAADYGSVPDERLDQLAASQMEGGAKLVQNQACLPLVRSSVKVQLLQQMDARVVNDYLNNTTVQLNPRYGRWDPSTPGLFTTSGSLSVPAS